MGEAPDDMTAAQRLSEIASIMAQAVLRLKCKKAIKIRRERKIPLDSFGNQSVHAHETSKTGERP